MANLARRVAVAAWMVLGCPRCGIGQPGSARWSDGGPQPMSDAAAVATAWGPFAVLRMNRLGSSFGATCDQINDG